MILVRILVSVFLLPLLSAQSAVIAIRGARVVDGTGSPARVANVIIRGSRIEAVGPHAMIPAGARVINAGGQTLIPGLFDLHTHLEASGVTGAGADWGKNLKAYLACGVTTVNDYAVYGEMFAPIRRLLSTGAVVGPRVNLAARISTPAGHGTEGGYGEFFTLIASTAEQAHAVMRQALPYHPDVIKVFTDGWRYGFAPDLTSMNLETLAAIVDDAHAAGIKVFTHTVTLGGARIAGRAGVELIEILKAHHTAYVSTLAVYERHIAPAPLALRLLAPDAGARIQRGSTRTSGGARERRWGHLLENVRRLHEAGIPIGAGTDAGMAGTYHGYASLHELELLVEAGLSPLQAIAAATSVDAKALGVDGDRGTIAPGKLADLVLIDGRPDEHVQEIEKTARVFLGGRELDPRRLEAEIQKPEPTPIPAHPIPALIDDMEQPGGRTRLDTLRVYSTDDGTDHSRISFLPVVRGGKDHSLMVEARLAAKEHPFVRLEIPLTEGAVELADLSQYSGIAFDARSDGAFRLEIASYGVRTGDAFAAPFQTSGAWQTIRIPFAKLSRKATGGPAWNPRDARALFYELSGPAGAGVWLDLDNVRLY